MELGEEGDWVRGSGWRVEIWAVKWNLQMELGKYPSKALGCI